MNWTRRDVLRVIAGGVATGCTGGNGGNGSSLPPCADSAGGADTRDCLIESLVVRVPNAAALQVGEAVLTNVDDLTAVIVARDAGGFYALSAICTHQCCLVSLCNDAACSSPAGNPGDCGTTPPESPGSGPALLCACHGSRFALDGSVVSGPASTPLPHLLLQLDATDGVVDTGSLVAATTRV